MTLWVRHDIIDEDTDFVSEAFVIFLVTASQNHLKGGFERRNDFGVDSELMNCLFAANLNQVPKSFNSEGNHVGTEVFGLTNDSYQVSSDSLDNDLVCNGFVQTDGGNCFQN